MTNFKVRVDENEYEVRYVVHGDPIYFSSTSYTSFEVKMNDEYIPLKASYTNELVRDLCCVMGLDPVKELANIIHEEAKKEIRELVKG